jgi:hypothetical protein
MTDVSTSIQTPDVAETVGFLRRFSDLMANGHNAAYLQRAAGLLESLSARVSAAADEEQLGRYKYETLARHADSLEAECDALRHDVEGHLDITNSILAERDALNVALQGRQAELAGLGDTLSRERDGFGAKSAAHDAAFAELRAAFDAERLALKTKLDAREKEFDQLRCGFEAERGQLVAKSAAQEKTLAELRAAFDQERLALKAKLEVRDKELEQLRRVYEREHEELGAKLKLREAELSELGLAFDRAQSELRSRQGAGADELAALRADSERERDALKAKVAALETNRAELRSSFERIGELRNQTLQDGAADRSGGGGGRVDAVSLAVVEQAMAPDEAHAVVPKAALQRARAQFEYLARECIRRGDIPSQVMCELGVHALDLALIADEEPAHLRVREAALDILAPSLAGTDPL